MLSIQPGLHGSNDLRVGRKMATFQLFFFSVGSDWGLISSVKKKLRGLSPRANYTDRAAAAGRRS